MLSLESHASRLSSSSRLAALRASGLLDDSTNAVLDRVARLAAHLLGVPMAAVSLVTDNHQYFAGKSGLTGWPAEQRGTPLAYSFCQHVVAQERTFLVEDASVHPLVVDNLGFRELGIVAYAGVPLTTREGETLGAFCALDTVARQWTPEQVSALEDLAAAAMSEIELRTVVRVLVKSQEELLTAQARLREQATRDDLTGLLNRRGFGEHARQQLAQAKRLGLPCLLINLDLDEFKGINDRLGHDMGDQALCEMASVLKHAFRTTDVVARIGGDEFVVLATNAGPNDITYVQERLGTALADRNSQPGREFQLVTSMGIAVYDSANPVSLAQLMRASDVQMYEHKRGRKHGRLTSAA